MNMTAKEQARRDYTPEKSTDSQHLWVTKGAFTLALCGPH